MISFSFDKWVLLVSGEMIFGERNVVGSEKSFTSTDLYQYVETLLKEAKQRDEFKKSSHYGWLKSRDLNDPSTEQYLEDLRPFINKMTSENSAAIAVKLDILTEEKNFTVADLLTLIKKLLLEKDNMSLMQKNIKGVKETKYKTKISKVRPELVGRQATVCFIVECGML